MLVCGWCGVGFERRSVKGPDPKFCRAAHRAAAHRARRAGAVTVRWVDGDAPGERVLRIEGPRGRVHVWDAGDVVGIGEGVVLVLGPGFSPPTLALNV